jgi:hypothetical protein
MGRLPRGTVAGQSSQPRLLHPDHLRWETRFTAIEQNRYEECSLDPGPENDAIVAAALVIWLDSLITRLNVIEKNDWPIPHTGFVLKGLFNAIREGSELTEVVEVGGRVRCSLCVLAHRESQCEPDGIYNSAPVGANLGGVEA